MVPGSGAVDQVRESLGMRNLKLTVGQHVISIALGAIAFGLWFHNVWAAVAFGCFLTILAEPNGKD